MVTRTANVTFAACLAWAGCAAKIGHEAGRDVETGRRTASQPVDQAGQGNQAKTQAGTVNVQGGDRTGDAWSERIAIAGLFVLALLGAWLMARHYGYEAGRAKRIKSSAPVAYVAVDRAERRG